MKWILFTICYLLTGVCFFGLTALLLTRTKIGFELDYSGDVIPVALCCLAWGVTLPVLFVVGLIALPFAVIHRILLKLLDAED